MAGVKKLILIGAPCTGKTTLAREYARKTGRKYLDIDEMFERRHGSIARYFDEYGEGAFRTIEQELISEAIDGDCHVIACGGGAVLSDRTMCALRAAGYIVRLNAPVELLMRRMGNSDRPLKDLRTITAVREQRYALYADATIDTACDDPLKMLFAAEEQLNAGRKNRYDVLLCDSDDTLLDFKKAMRFSVTAAAHAVGITSSDERIIGVYTDIVHDVWQKLERKEITRAQLDDMRFSLLARGLGESIDVRAMTDIYYKQLIGTRFVIDGALDFLKSVRSRGIKVYIITNSFTHVAVERLKALDGYNDGWFISEKIGFDKPDVRFFDAVFKSIGSPDRLRTLVMGDSVTSDIAGGLNCGAHTCLFDVTRSISSRAHYRVGSYAEALDIL